MGNRFGGACCTSGLDSDGQAVVNGLCTRSDFGETVHGDDASILYDVSAARSAPQLALRSRKQPSRPGDPTAAEEVPWTVKSPRPSGAASAGAAALDELVSEGPGTAQQSCGSGGAWCRPTSAATPSSSSSALGPGLFENLQLQSSSGVSLPPCGGGGGGDGGSSEESQAAVANGQKFCRSPRSTKGSEWNSRDFLADLNSRASGLKLQILPVGGVAKPANTPRSAALGAAAAAATRADSRGSRSPRSVR
mmetsp:Transcript_92255/g.298386  ORF Transcript_92255/g.298386 Transcript_92255/m.298386 type:complete len:250 (-) Transcript_92255:39-788(-)